MTAPEGPRPPFVPDDFAVPRELVTGEFRLEPLGPQHNAGDYEAWTSSMEHIRATPGFAGRPWPVPMTLEDNLGDLRRHERDLTSRSTARCRPGWRSPGRSRSCATRSGEGARLPGGCPRPAVRRWAPWWGPRPAVRRWLAVVGVRRGGLARGGGVAGWRGPRYARGTQGARTLGGHPRLR